MAVNNVRQQPGYSLNQPLTNIPYGAIVSKRAPLTTDKAPIGQIWVNVSTSLAYILVSIVANVSTWLVAGGSGAGAGIFASLEATTGDITADLGNIVASAGSVSAATTVTAGTGLIATTGGVTASAGNIVASAGSVSASTTVTGGTGIIATTGGVTASSGNIVATLGNITASAGNIAATLGSVAAGTTVTGGTGVVATTGNVTSSAGDLVASTAAKGVVLGGGAKVVCGTGDPNATVTAPKGSLYLNLGGSGAADRAWINTNSGTAWTNLITAG